MKKTFAAFLAIAALISGAAFADQRIQDNLTVDGTVLAEDGVRLSTGSALLAGRAVNSCAVPAQVSTAGTDTTPVATTFYYAMVYLPANTTVNGVSVFNGSVASGNIKVGLANAAGQILATSASTAMSGTDAYQAAAFTAAVTVPGPGYYFALFFVDNTTARFNTHTLAGTCVTGTVTSQVFATGFTDFTPATTFTTGVGPIASLF